MVKLIIGKKGTGKTKHLLDSVNKAAQGDKGNVVFINCGSRHVLDVSHDVRLVDTSPFEINSYCALYGFICGVISEDFDISNIFVDSVGKIVTADNMGNLEGFLKNLKKIATEFNVEFTLTMSIDEECAPEYIKEYA